MKKYIVLGGVNGAGKSTLYQILDNLKKMPRVNTDEIVKELGDWRNTSDVLKAGKIAVQLIDKYFSEGISFNQESTLCGNYIIKNFKLAKHYIPVGLFLEQRTPRTGLSGTVKSRHHQYRKST